MIHGKRDKTYNVLKKLNMAAIPNLPADYRRGIVVGAIRTLGMADERRSFVVYNKIKTARA